MRFIVRSDRRIVVAFEPTAAEYVLDQGDFITVEWAAGGNDGMVSFEAESLVVSAPRGGYNRAWDSANVEIYIGPESGPDAH